MHEELMITHSSGNVFADLGLSRPEVREHAAAATVRRHTKPANWFSCSYIDRMRYAVATLCFGLSRAD